MASGPDIGRRAFIAASIATASVSLLPLGAAQAAIPAAGPRALSFVNLHTGERLSTAYWRRGRYLGDACRRFDHLLRDHRTGDVAEISPALFDVLHALRRRLDTEAPFEVISGYRSPRTNAMLSAANGGVAQRSLHMQGMAIDIRIPGTPLDRLHKAAMSLRAGGVGYYARSNFVHVDVGRVRSW
ncbi:MAG: DUF882 domain-containing protein [Rhodospirillaceae bacterium]